MLAVRAVLESWPLRQLLGDVGTAAGGLDRDRAWLVRSSTGTLGSACVDEFGERCRRLEIVRLSLASADVAGKSTADHEGSMRSADNMVQNKSLTSKELSPKLPGP